MITQTATDLANRIGTQLLKSRISVLREFQIHDAIADALTELDVEFEREHRLTGASRLDFWLPIEAIAIEVKRQNAGINVVPQLGRYLEHSKVQGLILVANRIHPKVPLFLRSKPLAHLPLWKFHL